MKNSAENIYEINEGYDVTASDFIYDQLLLLQTTNTHSDKINIALSGGTTPLPVLERLKDKKLDWLRFAFFMVDERCVPKNHPQSNYGNIEKAFFRFISSDSFPMINNADDIVSAEEAYTKLILQRVAQTGSGIPKFHLIVLGVGSDGHTASLFPGTKALTEEKKLVVVNDIPRQDIKRMTLTYPVLLNAEKIIVLAKGADKKKIIEELYSDNSPDYPMLKIVQNRADVKWLLGN